MSDTSRPQQSVLIVEDDRDLRSMFAHALMFAGFRVHEAADGLQALRMVEADRPHVVVLDLALPTLDGLAVYDDIMASAATRSIPIVVVTASSRDLAQRLPTACVLRKPVMPDTLVVTIRECLERVANGG